MSMSNFCQICYFKNHTNDSICCKIPVNPACIDLIMTIKTKCFQNFITIETALLDFHKMTATVTSKSKTLN